MAPPTSYTTATFPIPSDLSRRESSPRFSYPFFTAFPDASPAYRRSYITSPLRGLQAPCSRCYPHDAFALPLESFFCRLFLRPSFSPFFFSSTLPRKERVQSRQPHATAATATAISGCVTNKRHTREPASKRSEGARTLAASQLFFSSLSPRPNA